jgi:flagellar motor switch protein FliN/FliY
VVELDRLAGEHLDVRINDTLVLKGEIVTIAETLGIRVTDVVSADERARNGR